MSDQPNPNVDDVTGYRRLSEHEINLLNEGKELANQVGDFIHKLAGMPDVDKTWLDIGSVDLRKGFMSVTRSIAKPTSF